MFCGRDCWGSKTEQQIWVSVPGQSRSHTRHGEHIHFLGPWACAEVLLGGLITHCEPWAWDWRRSLSHPLRTDHCVIPPGVVEWACNDDWFDHPLTHMQRHSGDIHANTDENLLWCKRYFPVRASVRSRKHLVEVSVHKHLKLWHLKAKSINFNGTQWSVGSTKFNLQIQTAHQ